MMDFRPFTMKEKGTLESRITAARKTVPRIYPQLLKRKREMM